MENIISIIVPVYNCEKYLEACVNSILNQTYENIEVILVDDGSLDNSSLLCDKFAQKDTRVIVKHRENRGVSAARNYGIECASGEFLMFVDADDYISEKMCETLLESLVKYNADMAICNYLCVDEDHNNLEQHNKYLPIIDGCLDVKGMIKGLTGPYGWFYVVAWNKLYKREIFNSLRFPEGKRNEDAFIAYKVIYKCEKIACVNEALYYYLQREGSITHTKFDVNNMDLGDALIEQYQFAKNKNDEVLKNYAVKRLSYEMEKWRGYVNLNKECKNKYDDLRRHAYFLLYEKKAWDGYSTRGKLYQRLELTLPGMVPKIKCLTEILK